MPRRPPLPVRRKHPAEVRARVPRDLQRRLHMVSLVTGTSVGEFVRNALDRAADDVLIRRGAFLYMRPGSQVYRATPYGVSAPLCATYGGERVLIYGRVEGLPTDLGQGEKAEGRGYLADLVAPPGEDGVTMRHVVVHAENVLPRSEPRTIQEGWGGSGSR